MDPPLYKPPLKRRRLSLNSSISMPQPIILSHSASPTSTNTDSNPNQPHPTIINHTHPPQQLHTFKSQLQDILELFPPFSHFISSHHNPNQLFNQLYQVFTSCSPSLSPQIHHINPSQNCPVHASLYALQNHIPRIPTLTTSNNHNSNCAVHGSIPPSDTQCSLDCMNPQCLNIITSATDKLVKKVYTNIELRCDKMVQSLNKTTKDNAKTCLLMKHFAINIATQRQIAYHISETLRSWKGARCLKPTVALTELDAFKMVRAHWNRKKAQTLGDYLFSVMLHNLFTIVSQITALSLKDQIIFYIDLFCGLLSDQIQFEQSMPRPLILNACFDKSVHFKKLCENMFDAFSRGTLKLMHIQTTKTCERNGKKVSKYIRNGKRSECLAQSCFRSLQELKPIVLSASNEYILNSMQSHLRWLNQSQEYPLELIKWERIPQHMLMQERRIYNNKRIQIPTLGLIQPMCHNPNNNNMY